MTSSSLAKGPIAEFRARRLEMQHNFRAAINPNRDYFKRRIFNEIIEETLGRQARGA